MIYCTLFNSNYLDKGIILINSLYKCSATFEIYVLCMDTLCYDILSAENMRSVHLIKLEDFEDEELLAVKDTRSAGEYCWTCTAKLIKYVLAHYNRNSCTYIDADMYFYSDPQILFEEMQHAKASVQVVAHRFAPTKHGKRQEKENGKICVQFNTFTQEKQSRELLDLWIRECLNECSVESAGDQKYLNDWGKYDFVNISKNAGAGMAPWNVARYKMTDSDLPTFKDRYDKKVYRAVFYHYQNLINIDRYHIRILPLTNYYHIDKNLIKRLYYPYVEELENVKCILQEKYNFMPMISKYITGDDNIKLTAKDILKQIFKNPIWLTLNKIKNRLLVKTRRKQAVVDVRELKKEKKQWK